MATVNCESQSVQNYLNILQSVINRMATNSSNCKTWCITLVSAIIVIIADKSNPVYIYIALVPMILFLFLDCYYLGLEKQFRNLYNKFIEKIHSDNVTINDLFILDPGNKKEKFGASLKAFKSSSIWPFYLLLSLMLIIVHKFILN